MPRETLSQKYFGQAMDDVQEVLQKNNEKMQTIYGGLCHKFPIMVLTCGLCQAVAFVESKTVGNDADRVLAYKLLREHVAVLLGMTADAVASGVRNASLSDYMRYTRRIRQAGVYYKRFAVSLLNVDSAAELENQEETT